MTALEQYIRLEAPGRWREHDGADWREVLVSFGNATLVLSDFGEEPLTHWALAAVERIVHEEGRAVYTPDAATREVLEVDDETMIEAIAQVSSYARARNEAAPRRRLRRPVLFGGTLAVLLGVVLFGPQLLRDRAFTLISPEQAEVVSEAMRSALPGRRCTTPEGQASLTAVSARVGGGRRVEVRSWQTPALALLPDGTILLSREVIEEAATAAGVAGWIALGAVAGPDASPLHGWVQGLGTTDLIRFLSTGDVPASAIAGLARALPQSDALVGDRHAEAAFALLQSRDIRPGPLADALGRPRPDAPVAPRPVLGLDRDWVALQNICEN